MAPLRGNRPHTWSCTFELILKSLACLLILLNCLRLSDGASGTEVACPWINDDNAPEELKSSCVCAQNPPSSNQLSVQCQDVDGHQLVALLSEAVANQGISVGLLYLNASYVTDDKGQVPEKMFYKLRLMSLQLSNCLIQSIHPDAFRGLENHLKHLSLTQNQLTEVPSLSVNPLSHLLLLDLSFNKITKVESGAFKSLGKLSTLKLNDNSLEMESNAFSGLEKSLKNLNLKGTRLSSVPHAITNLSSLAFLDLAQNRLRELHQRQFSNLHSLTALNLERNLLQSLPSTAFFGVNDTLSSLSLLNNLITHIPTPALQTLKELRVLDLGFNLLTEIPISAFKGLSSLTLLALDGNPLPTLPEDSFFSINNTLRGISIGGRFLTCDCRLKWIFDWITEYDLQVTSRERNPQFCGSPPNLRNLNFQQIKADELVCIKTETATSISAGKEEPVVPEETMLRIDTPMAVLEFENETSQAEDTQRDSSMVKEVTTDFPEKPKFPITEYHNPNNNGSRFRFRRPRPRPRSTTAKPIFISSTEKFTDAPLPPQPSSPQPNSEESDEENNEDSMENNAEEESKEEVPQGIPDKVENAVERPATKFVRPLPNRQLDLVPSQQPTSLPFSSTTRRYPTSLKALRSFPTKEIPKFSTSTATSVSVSSAITSSATYSIARDDDSTKVPLIRAKPAIPMTVTPKSVVINSRPSPAVVSKASIATKDFDDSKIPIISGVGPTRHTSEASNGGGNTNIPNIMKTPPSSGVQTQGVLLIQPPSPHPPPVNNPALGSPRSPSLIFAEKSEIIIRDIQRTSDSVMLRWESLKQLAGYRIIYRLFGEDAFRHGPPLAPTEREYRIKHIPFNECVVVCVVPYDDILYNEINPNAGSVPPGSQCRELKPTTPSVLMNHMDKITIGASAAICATVIIAVLLFIAITRRAKGKRSPSASTLVSKVPPSLMTPSPGPQGIPQGSMNLIKDWDQLSAVSARSIPRARVYHGSLDQLATGPSTNMRHSMMAAPSHRSIPDGHSTHRSYLSAHHHHHNHSMHAYGHHHGNGHQHHVNNHHGNQSNGFMQTQGRPMRQSMISVRSTHDMLNGKAYSGHTHQPHTHHQTHTHRHFEPNHKRKQRGAGRPSQSESLNTLSGYDTPDNWTDHDMDVYVARNHARHDLVQL